jgi:multiple RNA-binding domain-containing protein 1
MARKLGVRKSEILDADSDNMAVRLALAETNIINETKEYLEQEGVSLEAFTKCKKRSNNIILVKNIPSSTQESDLTDMFSKFGTLGRILLPPARTIALVEFPERNEAKVAFRKLAYTKFKNLPLYLEYAPEGTFIKDFDPVEAEQKRNEKIASNVKVIAEKDVDDEQVATATVFVKNLNFNTTEEGLKAAFDNVGGLRSAKISTKINPKYPTQKLSMGFGFLEFNSKEDAMRCIKAMQVAFALI